MVPLQQYNKLREVRVRKSCLQAGFGLGNVLTLDCHKTRIEKCVNVNFVIRRPDLKRICTPIHGIPKTHIRNAVRPA